MAACWPGRWSESAGRESKTGAEEGVVVRAVKETPVESAAGDKCRSGGRRLRTSSRAAGPAKDEGAASRRVEEGGARVLEDDRRATGGGGVRGRSGAKRAVSGRPGEAGVCRREPSLAGGALDEAARRRETACTSGSLQILFPGDSCGCPLPSACSVDGLQPTDTPCACWKTDGGQERPTPATCTLHVVPQGVGTVRKRRGRDFCFRPVARRLLVVLDGQPLSFDPQAGPESQLSSCSKALLCGTSARLPRDEASHVTSSVAQRNRTIIARSGPIFLDLLPQGFQRATGSEPDPSAALPESPDAAVLSSSPKDGDSRTGVVTNRYSAHVRVWWSCGGARGQAFRATLLTELCSITPRRPPLVRPLKVASMVCTAPASLST